jgi:hypothetical protein
MAADHGLYLPINTFTLVQGLSGGRREGCKHGGPHPFREEESSPEWEYQRYRKRVRPEHELLRQWCGDPGSSG